MHYRPEIDGLRSIAVVPVVLFHAGVGLFSGGFVGVDVFFVISGYLITSIIAEEIAQGRFSVVTFYERRARRILPALFLVLACCLPFAWMWMLPEELASFGRSLAATALFVSNAHFWESAGYFQARVELMPLLHTWSLAIEEQYYLVFPLLLLALRRRSAGQVLIALGTLAALSLALSEWGWRNKPDENFFFTFSRFWELLAGSICALLHRRHGPTRSNLLSLGGLAAVLTAVVAYDGSVPFPSVWTLLPVLGTALVILFGGTGTVTARLLSLPPFVGIGLISYSAYLWHQPLLAFARLRWAGEPPAALLLALAALSFALAYLSWRFVEQPFRRSRQGIVPGRRAVFALAVAGSALFVGAGLSGYQSGGYAGRLPPAALVPLQQAAERNPLSEHCMFRANGRIPPHPVPACMDFAPDGRIDVLFIGDSHSDAISWSAQQELKRAGLSSYAVSLAGCVGLPGFYRVDQAARHDCDGYNRDILAFARREGIRTLVITSRFTWYWDGAPFDNGEGGRESVAPGYVDRVDHRDEAARADDPARRDRVLASYALELEALAREFDVVLVYPIPEAGWDVPQLMARRAMFGGSPDGASEGAPLSTSSAVYRRRNGAVLAAFDALADKGVRAVRPDRLLCDTVLPGRCLNALDGQVLYYDSNHLSRHGAELLAPLIREQVVAAREASLTPAATGPEE